MPDGLKSRYPFNHFSAQVNQIEEMMMNGKKPNHVERTLLTTGALAALFESSYQPNVAMYGRTQQHGQLLDECQRVETPLLNIAYRVHG